ncbi:MAG: MAPEG family protein [Shimia sp.]
MTSELIWLSLTLILASSLWIPLIIGVNTTESGQQVTGDGRANVPGMLPWVHRAHRAHLNLLKQAMPFAGLILIAHVAGVSSLVTVWAAAAFFFIRLAHAAFMIAAQSQFPVRPTIFTLGWLCRVAVFVEVLCLT